MNMFNLFPKKKSVDEIVNDANLTPSWQWTPTQTPSVLQAQNEIIEELMKEVNGLRHLKKENIELMERVNEIDSDQNEEYRAEILTLKNDIAVLKAKYQILEHNYQGCVRYRDEYKHQLNAANKENEELKKRIDGLSLAIDRKNFEVDECKTAFESTRKAYEQEAKSANKELEKRLELEKEYEVRLKELNNGLVDVTRENKKFCKIIEDQKAEIEKLKKDIVDYVLEKDDRINNLQKELNHMKAVAEGAISLCDLSDKTDYDLAMAEIKKTQDWNNLKQRKTHKVCVCNHCGYKVSHNTNYFGGCGFCKEGLMIEKEEVIDWMADEGIPNDEEAETTINTLKNMKTQGFEDYDPTDFVEQKHPMYPIHWSGYDKNIKEFVESEFNNEDNSFNIDEYISALSNAYQKAKDLTKDVEVDLDKPLDEQCDEVKKAQKWSTLKVTMSNAVQAKQKEVEFDAEELLKRTTEFTESLSKILPNESQKEKKWICPCNVCKIERGEK